MTHSTDKVIEQLVEALVPFARDAQGIHPDWSDERRRASLTQDKPLTVGDFRKAVAALTAGRAALKRAQGEACISVNGLRDMRKNNLGYDTTQPNYSMWLGFNQALDAAIDYAEHYPSHPQASEPEELITVESSLRFRLQCEQQRSADLLEEVRELKGKLLRASEPAPIVQTEPQDKQEASEFHIALLRELADTKQSLLATENQLATSKRMLATALREAWGEPAPSTAGEQLNRATIVELAKRHGTRYVNRHFPEKSSYGFMSEGLIAFATAVAELPTTT